MTVEQALEIVTNAIQTEHITAEQDMALAIVQKALEKQIPSGQALEWRENKVIIIKQGNINKSEPQNMKHFECYNCGCIYEVEEKDCNHFHIGDSYTSFCPCCHAPNSVD